MDFDGSIDIIDNTLFGDYITMIRRNSRGFDMTEAFRKADKKEGKTFADVASLSIKPNKKTGARIARAVFNDGSTIIKSVSTSGVSSETFSRLPSMTTIKERNRVIRDLPRQHYDLKTIASMLDISESTVSVVLNGKTKGVKNG